MPQPHPPSHHAAKISSPHPPSHAAANLIPIIAVQELENAGRDALWRAAAGFQPGRSMRFSSYAVPAVQNSMRDVLRHRREVGMHVPKEAHPWQARVRAAARSLQRQEQRRQPISGQQRPVQRAARRGEQPATAEGADLQQRLANGQRSRQQRQQQQQQQQQTDATPLERLAAAAHVTPRQAQLGLAAGRRQRLASFGCLVVAEAAEGAGGRRSNRSDQLARFGDVPQPEQQEQDEVGKCGS